MDIGAHTLRTWGEDQTLGYIDDLEACCQRLANNPMPLVFPAMRFCASCGAANPGCSRLSAGACRVRRLAHGPKEPPKRRLRARLPAPQPIQNDRYWEKRVALGQQPGRWPSLRIRAPWLAPHGIRQARRVFPA